MNSYKFVKKYRFDPIYEAYKKKLIELDNRKELTLRSLQKVKSEYEKLNETDPIQLDFNNRQLLESFLNISSEIKGIQFEYPVIQGNVQLLKSLSIELPNFIDELNSADYIERGNTRYFSIVLVFGEEIREAENVSSAFFIVENKLKKVIQKINESIYDQSKALNADMELLTLDYQAPLEYQQDYFKILKQQMKKQ